MTSESSFLLVYALFYLWQCCHWFRPGAIALIARRGGATELRSTDPQAESRLGSPILAPPLPPLGEIHALAPWPFAVDQDRIVSFQERSWTRHSRPRQRIVVCELDRIDRVEADARKIMIDGRFFAEALDEMSALDLVDLIGDLIEAERADRPGLIAAALAASLDRETTQRAIADLRAEARPLRLRANLLFVCAGLIMPAAFLSSGAGASWLVVLPLVAATNIATVLRYRAAHRRLAPELVGLRLATVVTMVLFPPETMRAHDYLTRFALSDRHALPVVDALCDEPTRVRFLGHLLRDLRHPIPAIEPLPTEVAETTRTMRELETRLILAAADPRILAEAIAVEGPDEPHCPRCLQATAAAICDSCRLPITA